MRIINKHLTGHLSLGPVTIYGSNAMNWAINIKTKRWGYICAKWPTKTRSGGYEWYFYLSPNATPWACTFYMGSDKDEAIRAQIRKLNFGHGFKASDVNIYTRLYALNNRFYRFQIDEYDVFKFGVRDE